MATNLVISFFTTFCWLIISCNEPGIKTGDVEMLQPDSILQTALPEDMPTADDLPPLEADSLPRPIINTHHTSAADIVNFAKTLIGTPYKYASTDPAQGFDCSGFITYVFNNFKIQVPRSSLDFTNAGIEVPVEQALPGDLILFTGTDSTKRLVGHMGIINDRTADSTTFIHSTSGKAYGVTITRLNDYYKGRFVKVIRIFNKKS